MYHMLCCGVRAEAALKQHFTDHVLKRRNPACSLFAFKHCFAKTKNELRTISYFILCPAIHGSTSFMPSFVPVQCRSAINSGISSTTPSREEPDPPAAGKTSFHAESGNPPQTVQATSEAQSFFSQRSLEPGNDHRAACSDVSSIAREEMLQSCAFFRILYPVCALERAKKGDRVSPVFGNFRTLHASRLVPSR